MVRHRQGLWTQHWVRDIAQAPADEAEGKKLATTGAIEKVSQRFIPKHALRETVGDTSPAHEAHNVGKELVRERKDAHPSRFLDERI